MVVVVHCHIFNIKRLFHEFDRNRRILFIDIIIIGGDDKIRFGKNIYKFFLDPEIQYNLFGSIVTDESSGKLMGSIEKLCLKLIILETSNWINFRRIC
jgi:hypothetical protein